MVRVMGEVVREIGEAVRLIEEAAERLRVAGLPAPVDRLARLSMLLRKYCELLEVKERLTAEINEVCSRAVPLRGSLVYKWVLNKVKKKYWYWYLHVKEDGRTRSIYLGARVPEWIVKGIEARYKVRMLEARLRRVARRIDELEREMASSP